MNFLQESPIGDLTRGGQLILHFLRMIGQVLRKFGMALLISTVITSGGLFFLWTDSYERYLGLRYLLAHAQVSLFRNDAATTLDRTDGSVVGTTHRALAQSAILRETTEALTHSALRAGFVGMLSMGALFLVIFAWVWRTGTQQREERRLRGAWLADQDTIRGILRRARRASDLSIAGVPLVKGTETLHILVTGSTGTGKSTALHGLLKRIRERGERCICYSRSGDFIEWFYRESKDHILNPFDARCPTWNLWDECPDSYHHDMLASALVPQSGANTDPFWYTSARILVAALTQVMDQREERSIPRLLELLSQVPLETLHQYLQGTEAAAVVDPESEKTAASVRLTAVTYVRALRYLPKGRTPFHIRQWVQDESHDQWVFLNATADQIASVRPVISAWLEVFTSALLSLPANRNRRVWLVLDELATLHRVPSLLEYLAESRKNGGCGVISFQDVAQLRDRWTENGAIAITGQCATWVVLRANDPETAKWAASSFGQVEVLEANQGMSYGANDMRDGISLTQNRKVQPLLLDSQILNLNELEGYIRLPGELPVTRFRQQPLRPKIIAPAFVPAPRTPRIILPGPIAAAPMPPVPTAAPVPAPAPVGVTAGLFDEEPANTSTS